METIEEITFGIATGFITENRRLIGNETPLICIALNMPSTASWSNRFMEQPLSEKLTPEEREKIKALHDRREQTADLYLKATCINAQESSAIDYCKGYVQALHDIFGKPMFEEKGGENGL